MGTVRALLDTCTFIWLCAEPARLTAKAVELLNDEQTELALSDVTTLEITLKWGAGKLSLPDPPRAWVEEQIRIWSPLQLQLTRDDIYRAGELPRHHADPFDRLLVATAINHNAVIVTPDASIHQYPVSYRW